MTEPTATAPATTTKGSDDSATLQEDVETPRRLKSLDAGQSEVEQIAERIETRRQNRVCVTYGARLRFLKDCYKLSYKEGGERGRISAEHLIEYRDRVVQERENRQSGILYDICTAVGLYNDLDCLVIILDRAVQVTQEAGYHHLYYSDFNFDHVRVVTRFPMFRNEFRTACLIVFLFYLFTPILFCNMMDESNICGGTDFSENKDYVGWVSALYFASTTMSTVGYGDLSVSQDDKWKSFIGSMYMLLAMGVAVTAFSATAAASLSPLENVFDRIFARWDVKGDEMFLHDRIRRLKFLKFTELLVEIFTFIAVGVFAARIAIQYEDDPDRQWNWMTTFYWAVQTTTTIGYGDLDQPFGLRYFKIVYLMASTVLVGNALGKLGSLRQELSEIRRQHAWDRRKISKRFINEMQAYEHDDKVDQYEFLVASLISLGKISSEDVKPIMDKFRALAGEKGFITAEDVADFAQDSSSNALLEDAHVGHSD
uniref:Potassium channel domain-containing protein n=1 Tax=Amphora coffeiformis TaxID=265554 RepID=A0A6S8HY86_9STRA|mmetsp:Transcript_9411/g.17982  ORF Transcript_9411/g.17982 Transcript_9411/m.17982 type:complete len:484 (+) Transcript_9411:149-1600(+)